MLYFDHKIKISRFKMNQKESMQIHIRLDPETYRRVKHICVDLGKSMQDYVHELIKQAVIK